MCLFLHFNSNDCLILECVLSFPSTPLFPRCIAHLILRTNINSQNLKWSETWNTFLQGFQSFIPSKFHCSNRRPFHIFSGKDSGSSQYKICRHSKAWFNGSQNPLWERFHFFTYTKVESVMTIETTDWHQWLIVTSNCKEVFNRWKRWQLKFRAIMDGQIMD